MNPIPPTRQSHWTQVNGLNIHYFAAGVSGSPVILLHGAGVDSARLSWELTIDTLAQEHRVFAPDLPGYGQSDKPDVVYNVDFYIDFLSQFLDALHLPPVALVGLSMGGAVALGFTLRFPQQVTRLAPVDPYGIMPKVAWHKLSYLYVRTPLNQWSYTWMMRDRGLVRWTLRTSLISDPARLTDTFVDEVIAAAQAPQAGQAFASFQRHDLTWKGLRTNYIDRLGEIRVPTLFINGEKDPGVPLKYTQQAHQRVPGSQLYVMAGCLHWPMRDRPDEFNRVLADFLRDG